MYTQEQIAKLLNITRTTLHNWKTEKPYLYKIVMQHFKKKESRLEEIEELFEQLDDIEKEMYLAEIKAKVLRKKLNEKG